MESNIFFRNSFLLKISGTQANFLVLGYTYSGGQVAVETKFMVAPNIRRYSIRNSLLSPF